jgi:hypothetical protein
MGMDPLDQGGRRQFLGEGERSSRRVLETSEGNLAGGVGYNL